MVKSNHEQIRVQHGKSAGFSCIWLEVHVILLADFFELGAVAMGMPLENAYLFHGHKGRDFNDSSYWKTHLHQGAGFIHLPHGRCIRNYQSTIVEQSPYDDYSESRLRSSEGARCVEMLEMFPKNSLKGKAVLHCG